MDFQDFFCLVMSPIFMTSSLVYFVNQYPGNMTYFYVFFGMFLAGGWGLVWAVFHGILSWKR